MSLSSRRCPATLSILFIFIYFGKDTCNLLVKQSLQILLSLVVKFMLLAEPKGELRCRVAFVDNDALLFVGTEVDVDEKKWRVRLIKVLFLLVVTFAVVALLVLTFPIIILLLQRWQWLAIWDISVRLIRKKKL